MTTHWRCEKCGYERSVRHKADAGVYDVRNQIERSHQKADPVCAFSNGLTYVRVVAAPGEERT